MTRCPKCHRPNPGANEFCWHCGEALPVFKRPWLLASDWLDLNSAWAALAAALGLGLLRVLSEARFMVAVADREEGVLAGIFILLGTGLGLGLAAVRRDWRRLMAWGLLGAVGGTLSYSLDFFYNYQHDIYKAVWWLVFLVFPSGDNRAGEMAFGILQLLRFMGSSLLLLIAASWNQTRAAPLFKAALFWLLAASLIFRVRGALLQPALNADFVGEFSLYFTALFLLFYGLARLDESTPK